MGLALPTALTVSALTALLCLGCDPPGRPTVDRLQSPAITADDASHLDRTVVAGVYDVPSDPAEARQWLATLLAAADRQHLPVAIGGARHSMGGQSLPPPAGVLVNLLPYDRMALDADGRTLHVGAGARWAAVVAYLAARGRAVAVMQSNDDFSVGGSLSVDCHGWQPNSPPIAATVRAFTMMLADGRVVRCSRAESADLFRLALGGYGLFGVILDVDLDTVPDVVYRPEQAVVSVDGYADLYDRLVNRAVPGTVGMAYGRISVAPGATFGRESLLTVFRPVAGPLPPTGSGGAVRALFASLGRGVFRGSVHNAAVKLIRWRLEELLGEVGPGGPVRRSDVQGTPASLFGNRRPDRTDILQEYFVPPAQLAAFVTAVGPVLADFARPDDPDLLNITVRDVCRDDDAAMAYARLPHQFGLVMLFEMPATPAAAAREAAIARRLTDAALAVGGTYYLPYRLDATAAQFRRAYPQAATVFAAKRRYDPHELFRNRFYDAYGR